MRILNFISNSSLKLIDVFKELAEDSSEIDIAVAYVKSSGLDLIEEFMRGKSIRMIFTFDFLITEPECVKRLIDLGCECREYRTAGNDEIGFHPKLYIFKKKNLVRIIVGSSNLTAGGLLSNIESCIVIEGTQSDPIIKKILDWFESLWNSSKATIISQKEIEEYISKKREYERKHQEVDRILKELKGEKGYANSVIICMSKEHDKNDIYDRLIGVPARSGGLFFKWVRNGSRIFIYYINHGIAKIVKAIGQPFISEEIIKEWEDGYIIKGEKYPNRVFTKLIAKYKNPVTLEELVELGVRRMDTGKVICTAHLRHSVVPISDADGDAIEHLLKVKNEKK
ncbi:hypothetical protein DRP04_05010 [Archaeoglobales archaeon]|nr:MAG: hypothetical protein DRP04_05010 [Archaeoglobales archaeon]